MKSLLPHGIGDYYRYYKCWRVESNVIIISIPYQSHYLHRVTTSKTIDYGLDAETVLQFNITCLDTMTLSLPISSFSICWNDADPIIDMARNESYQIKRPDERHIIKKTKSLGKRGRSWWKCYQIVQFNINTIIIIVKQYFITTPISSWSICMGQNFIDAASNTKEFANPYDLSKPQQYTKLLQTNAILRGGFFLFLFFPTILNKSVMQVSILKPQSSEKTSDTLFFLPAE